MSVLTYLPPQPEQVLQALREGNISAIEVASEEIPDLFLHYAIESGLLEALAKTFPDTSRRATVTDPPKQQPEIGIYHLLAAGIAGHFAGLYALSQLPYALHSPKLLALLGVQVVVNAPGKGLCRRMARGAPIRQQGNQRAGLLSVRKLLEQIAEQDQQAKHLPGQSLLNWYNASVGELFCRAADAKPCVHILDCTDLIVPLKNENYEHSGLTTKNNKAERGYKLASLRSLLDEGAVMTAIAWGQIQEHDLALTRNLVRTCPHLHPGDVLIEDRGFVDACTLTYLKKERRVDVCTGLKQDMLLLRGAIAQAQANPGAWQPHPTRKAQQIQRVEGIGSLWDGRDVPLNVCVVRHKNKQTGEWQYLGFATTDLSLSAKQTIALYQTRPEIEEDYRQLKSPSWGIAGFLRTRLVQILWHVCLSLIAFNLFQVYANTDAGRAFAGKTKQKIERELRRPGRVYFLVCSASAFGVYEAKELLYLMLDLPEQVRQRIRLLLQPKLE